MDFLLIDTSTTNIHSLLLFHSECDMVVKIPGKGSDSVDSLNVSVTGALLLYGLLSDPCCFTNSNSK